MGGKGIFFSPKNSSKQLVPGPARFSIFHEHLLVKPLESRQPESPESQGFPCSLDKLEWGVLTRGSKDAASWPRDGNLVHQHRKEGAGVSVKSGLCSCPLPSASWLQWDLWGCGCMLRDRTCRRRDTANTYEKILLS